MNLNEIKDLDKKYFMNVFGERIPVCFEYGKGMKLWDTCGREYYDFYAGIAVSALGHSHPKLVEAICNQAGKLIHTSNMYYIESQAKLARMLAEHSCADKVFFANSGAEANEGAIKLARLFHRKAGYPEKYEIITLINSFHGRTLATISATGQDKFRKPMEPLLPRFVSVPANDFEALRSAVNSSTCAVMMEPIQGESGVNPLDTEYVRNVRKLCDEKGLLLIFDEVQTGIGRTGKLFAYEHFGIEPDIFTLAKALGGGIPIGAVCAKEFVARAFEPGDHGSTFGGNPLACTAALTVMEQVTEGGLVDNARAVGDYFKNRLLMLKDKYPALVEEVRGKGLMLGIQYFKDVAGDVRNKCFEKGFLIGSVGLRINRILPPLIVSESDVDLLIEALDKIYGELEGAIQ